MGHRVIGLTRSGMKLRAAVIETRLRKYELKTVLEVDLTPVGALDKSGVDMPEEPQLETIGVALNRMLVPPLSPSDSIVTAYPGDAAFIRRLSFPFKDRARISEVLPVELGGTLPTGLETTLHTNFERAGGDGNEIIAVGVQREAFASWLSLWRAEGVEPANVSMESLELAAWLPLVSSQDAPDLLIVSVEGDSVEFLVASGLSVRICRSIRVDGGVFKGGDLTGTFMREVLLCVAAASEVGAPLDRVLVCGEDAVMLAGAISESTGIECGVLDPATVGIPGAANCDGLDSRMARPVALAMGVADGTGPAALNLRTGEFGLRGAAGLLRERARFFVTAAVLFALLGAGWTTVRYVGLANDRRVVEKQLVEFSSMILEREVEDFDGALAEVRAGAREELGLFPAWTAVGTLEKITRAVLAAGPAGAGAVPSSVTAQDGESVDSDPGSDGVGQDTEEEYVDKGHSMELEQIEVAPRQVTIRGEAESIEKVDELIARLRADPCFNEIVTESTERVQFQRHQGWQKFRVRMNVDCSQKEGRKAAPAGTPAAPAAAPAAAPVAEEVE